MKQLSPVSFGRRCLGRCLSQLAKRPLDASHSCGHTQGGGGGVRGCDLVGSLCDPGKGGGLGGGISSQGSRQGPGAWGRDLEAAVRKLKTCVPPVEESCLHFINSQGQSFLDTNRQAMGLGQKPDVLRLRDLQSGIPPPPPRAQLAHSGRAPEAVLTWPPSCSCRWAGSMASRHCPRPSSP